MSTVSVVVLFGVVFVVLVAYSALNRQPTCFDYRQNQDELGVDCGGICVRRCSSEVLPLTVLWSRPFEVSSGFWSVAAYIENPNLTSYADSVSYRFSLYDKENVIVKEIEGSTFIDGGSSIPVFVGGVQTGERRPFRAFFELTSEPDWQRLDERHSITLLEQELTDGLQPRIEATLRNKEVRELRNIEIVAIVYGLDGNAIGVSKTIVPRLLARDEQRIIFTWPAPWSAPVGRVEIIPRVPHVAG